LRLIRSRQLREGALSHAPAGGAIHRVANLGTEIAISIHVYGVPYDRLGHDVNDVRAD
jgi:predicted metal-dependent enzyme (double-stranded beta helix superfamily)